MASLPETWQIDSSIPKAPPQLQRTKDEQRSRLQSDSGYNNSVQHEDRYDDLLSEEENPKGKKEDPYDIAKEIQPIQTLRNYSKLILKGGIFPAILNLLNLMHSQAPAFIPRDFNPLSSSSLEFIVVSLSSSQEREAARKQQRGRAPPASSSGWKPCKQLKHYKQASHRLRGMGTATEAQILCFMDRQFDVTQLPAGIPSEMTDMKLEENRLKSFSLDGRPAFASQCSTGQTPEELAACGFFYMQDTDRVKCAFCLGVLFNWKAGEGVQDAHRLRFSTCPLLLGLDVGNRPMLKVTEPDDKLVRVAVACSEDSEPASGSEAPLDWSRDLSARHPHPDAECCSDLMRRPRPPVSAAVATAACRPGAADNLELFARSLHSPDTAARYHPMMYPDWRDLDRREDSLARSSQVVPADMLACAGFFLDARQRTTCFWCGLQLQSWLGSDDPWVEHARWSPRCCHLLLARGHEFVLAARAACPPYPLQKLQRPQQGSSSGQLQTDSPGNSGPEETSTMLSFVTGSNQLIDYRIEPRYFKAREDFPPTLAALHVGCDPDDVKTAQFLQLKGTGDDFATYELFLHSVLSQNRRRQQLSCVTSGREFYEQVQREQAQACSREPRALGEDEVDWRACKVCMDKVINTTLLDCKHLCCCSDCAKRLDACPLCRSPIRATMLVNMD